MCVLGVILMAMGSRLAPPLWCGRATACNGRPAGVGRVGESAADALADHFKGRGPWKKRLPQIIDTLEALGRACKAPGTGATRWTHA